MRAPEGPREPRQLDERAHKSRLCGFGTAIDLSLLPRIDSRLPAAEHCIGASRAGADILTKTGNAGESAAREPLIRPERYGFFDKLLFAVFVLAVPPFIASNWSVFRDGDVSWHVAAGRWIMEHGRVPKTDPFSFTMAGQPWVAHEWLGEIIYAIGFDLAGHAGLASVVTLTLMALFAVVFAFMRKRAGPAAMLGAFAALYLVLVPFLMARPHVFAWAFLAAWSAWLLDVRDKQCAPPWTLALLMFVWANFHASFLMGFVVAGAVALDACIADKWKLETVRRWFLFGVICAIAALLNANGIAGVLHPMMISGMESLPSIAEWRPSNPNSTPFFYGILLAAIAALLIKRPQFRIGELLLLVVTLGLAFNHIRHQSVFIILAVLIVTPKLAGGARQSAPPLFSSATERTALVALALALAVSIAGIRAAFPLHPRETFANPRGLIANIPPELRSQPLLNEYSLGGPLILDGVRPFIDGRADMYGDEFVKDYVQLPEGDWALFNRLAKRYRFRWTMLQNSNKLIPKLDASPDWRRVYSDEVGVIHVRRNFPLSSQTTSKNQSQDQDPR